jgi:hypothetical protein
MDDDRYQIQVVKSTDISAAKALPAVTGAEKDENPKYLDTVASIVKNALFCDCPKRWKSSAWAEPFRMAAASLIQVVTVKESKRGQGIVKEIIRERLKYLKEHDIQWIGLISEPGYEVFTAHSASR